MGTQTTKEQAIEWFETLTKSMQIALVEHHLPNRPFCKDKFLSDSEIETIWKAETQFDKERAFVAECFNSAKPNQKQFTQFDEELFKKYIDKFSDEDRVKAFKVIFFSLNNPISLVNDIIEYVEKKTE